MKRTLVLPLAVGFTAGGLVWLIQNVLRPAAFGHPTVLWLLGPAPNVVVGFWYPFLGLAYPFESLTHTRRAVTFAALLTVGILVAFEFWRPFPGARTYDPLDIVGSVVGALAGAIIACAFARRVVEGSARL